MEQGYSGLKRAAYRTRHLRGFYRLSLEALAEPASKGDGPRGGIGGVHPSRLAALAPQADDLAWAWVSTRNDRPPHVVARRLASQREAPR